MARIPKRTYEPSDANWADEGELQRVREKKRKLEDAEPYNAATVRKKARQAAQEEARHGDASAISDNVPRGLSIEGESSSEFISVDQEREVDGAKHGVGNQATAGGDDGADVRSERGENPDDALKRENGIKEAVAVEDKENVHGLEQTPGQPKAKKKRRFRKRKSKNRDHQTIDGADQQ